MEPATASSPPLDPMSEFLKAALHSRGIPALPIQLEKNTPTKRFRPWLTFTIGGQDFLYRSGALIEAGADDWWRAGLNINHRAQVLIAHKYKSKMYLKDRGFGVPEGYFFRRRHLEEALAAFDRFSGPVCVKPNHGSEGHCVYPSITEKRWYDQAIRRVAEHYPTILAEESIEGEHFRFFYIDPHVVAIRCGRPLSVVGDGISSLADLLEAKNEARRQRALPNHQVFRVNQETLDYLEQQGRHIDDVAPAGERVFLRGASNANAGADSYLYWDEVHPSYRKIVEEACQSMPGLYLCGVDLIIRDMSQPAERGNYWILEMNSNPAITSYYYPWEGKTVDVADLLIEMLHRNYA